MIHRPLAIALLATALAACEAVGPDYERPPIETGAAYLGPVPAATTAAPPSAPAASMPAASMPAASMDETAPWWRGFDDPLLVDLVERALDGNLDIEAARSRLIEARALARGSRADLAPTLDAGADAGVAFSGDDDERSTEGSAGLGLAFDWALDVFGGGRRAVEAAEAEVRRRESLRADAARAVAAEVATVYVDLRGAQTRRALVENSLDLQEQTLSLVRTRYDAGLAPRLDLVRAEADVAQSRAELAPLAAEVRQRANALAVLTGTRPGSLDAVLTDPEPIPALRSGPGFGVPADLLRRRPDLRAAEADLMRTTAEIGMAEADLYPRFRLPGELAVGVTGLGTGDIVQTVVAALSAAIDAPLFDGGARAATVDAARARAREALATYRLTLLRAIEEVEAALHGLAGAAARRDALIEAVASGEEAYEQARALYSQGLASFIDVLDAQRVVTDSRLALAAAANDYARQAVALHRAAGSVAEPAG